MNIAGSGELLSRRNGSRLRRSGPHSQCNVIRCPAFCIVLHLDFRHCWVIILFWDVLKHFSDVLYFWGFCNFLRCPFAVPETYAKLYISDLLLCPTVVHIRPGLTWVCLMSIFIAFNACIDGYVSADPDDPLLGGHECCWNFAKLPAPQVRENHEEKSLTTVCVRINQWPPLKVSRTSCWGWRMENFMVVYQTSQPNESCLAWPTVGGHWIKF
jgi:hypothetical protein